MDRLARDASSGLSIHGQVLSAIDAKVPDGSNVRGSNMLGELYAACIGSGNQQRLRFTDLNTSLLKALHAKVILVCVWVTGCFLPDRVQCVAPQGV